MISPGDFAKKLAKYRVLEGKVRQAGLERLAEIMP